MVNRNAVGDYIKDLSLIQDPRLREEVRYCTNNDPDCSPFADRIGRAIGRCKHRSVSAPLAQWAVFSTLVCLSLLL